jgi:GTP-binding protein
MLGILPKQATPRAQAPVAVHPIVPTFTRFDTARFLISIADLAGLNAPALAQVPEVAFVGRSNAGKSSAINALTNRTRLAYASKMPGRTQTLNFFALDAGRLEATTGYLVDLPGYGFAKVGATTRDRWNNLVGGYLVERRQLRGVVLVVDSRRGLLPAAEDLIGLLCQRDPQRPAALHMLLSKADQIKTVERRSVVAATQQRAQTLPLPVTVQLFSARGREGIEQLQQQVGRMLSE